MKSKTSSALEITGIVVGLILIALVGFVAARSNSQDQAASLSALSLQVAPTALSQNYILCNFQDKTPRVQVFSPNGGESYAPGQLITVKWATCNVPAGDTMDVRITAQQAGNPTAAFTSGANTGQALLVIPPAATFKAGQIQMGQVYRVTVRDMTSNAADSSDGLFTIGQAPIQTSGQIQPSVH